MSWLGFTIQPGIKLPEGVEKDDYEYLNGDIQKEHNFEMNEAVANEKFRDNQLLERIDLTKLPEGTYLIVKNERSDLRASTN